MSRRVGIFVAVAFAAMLGKISLAQSVESNAFIQANISAAKIVQNANRYEVDVSMLATDLEQMFQKGAGERVGVDLSQPGVLEREIGKFVASRIEVRDNNGVACSRKIERAGEDPTNDEGVLVVLGFECPSSNATYDATKFLAAAGPRAWQVVTIMHGDAKRQIMVNSESATVRLSGAE